MNAKSTRIDWESAAVIEAIILTGVGLSTKVVAAQTGLSAGQLGYRLRRLGFGDIRTNYREGKSEAAKAAYIAARGSCKKMASLGIKNYLGQLEAATPGTAAPRKR